MSLREQGHSIGNRSLTLEDIEDEIASLNEEARGAAGQRLHSVGTAIGKIGIGGLLAVDSARPFLHLWSQGDKPEFFGLIIGAAVVAWGFKDAGHVSYDFAHARDLNNQISTLRSALNRRYEQAISRIPNIEFVK